jgi:hypothetical protein
MTGTKPQNPPASPDQGTPEHEQAMAELAERSAERNAQEVAGTPPPEPPQSTPPAPPAETEG